MPVALLLLNGPDTRELELARIGVAARYTPGEARLVSPGGLRYRGQVLPGVGCPVPCGPCDLSCRRARPGRASRSIRAWRSGTPDRHARIDAADGRSAHFVPACTRVALPMVRRATGVPLVITHLSARVPSPDGSKIRRLSTVNGEVAGANPVPDPRGLGSSMAEHLLSGSHRVRTRSRRRPHTAPMTGRPGTHRKENPLHISQTRFYHRKHDVQGSDMAATRLYKSVLAAGSCPDQDGSRVKPSVPHTATAPGNRPSGRFSFS